MSMGKKKRERAERAALIEARVVAERRWAWERRVIDGLTYPAIRALALRPDDLGGIGRDIGIATIKGLVAAHRADQGEIVGTRDERIERRQLEYDAIAGGARAQLMRADKAGWLDEKAAKLLLDVRTAEAKMHGDDAALRIDADVTHHDGATAELFAMLDEAGIPHEERIDT